MNRILRIRQLVERYGRSRSPIYADILAGLWPRAVKLGPRAAGWPESECEQVIAARIGGADDSAIRKLVAKLHEARAQASQRTAA